MLRCRVAAPVLYEPELHGIAPDDAGGFHQTSGVPPDDAGDCTVGVTQQIEMCVRQLLCCVIQTDRQVPHQQTVPRPLAASIQS